MKILLVSDDEQKSKELESKLIFLRADDKVVVTDYSNVYNQLNISDFSIVLVHENNTKEDTFNLISNLKSGYNIPILLVPINNNSEFILSCIDLGVDDFVYEYSEDFEFVIRIVRLLRYNSQIVVNSRNGKILEELKVVDFDNNFIYNNDFAKLAVEKVIDDDLISTGSFVVLSPYNTHLQQFSSVIMNKAIKQSIRVTDIVCLGKGNHYYLFLPNTTMNSAIVIFNKIKERVNFDICAGISDISSKSYDEFLEAALDALAEAISSKTGYAFARDDNKEPLDSWLDDSPVKNYKIFRQIFNKKLEKVITPVFYRLQQVYENKLFDSIIEQDVSDDCCKFIIKNKDCKSSLKIIYPGFSKIVISIDHEGLDRPDNREIQLTLAEVTEKELITIIENFVEEYRTK